MFMGSSNRAPVNRLILSGFSYTFFSNNPVINIQKLLGNKFISKIMVKLNRLVTHLEVLLVVCTYKKGHFYIFKSIIVCKIDFLIPSYMRAQHKERVLYLYIYYEHIGTTRSRINFNTFKHQWLLSCVCVCGCRLCLFCMLLWITLVIYRLLLFGYKYYKLVVLFTSNRLWLYFAFGMPSHCFTYVSVIFKSRGSITLRMGAGH